MISRRKWKDAVDIYFLMKHMQISLATLLMIAETQYFIGIWNRDAILEQLISMDWDTTEAVYYLIDSPPTDEEIMVSLKDMALKIGLER
jgi:hypothetical protein